MNTRVRRGASALAIVTLALVGAACGSDDDKTSTAAECPFEPDESVTTKARIAWQAIPNADVVVKDLGLLEACLPNADVSWVQASSGGDVIKYYGAGEVDLGLMGSAPASRSASAPLNRDIDIQTIWIHDVIGDAESLIVKDGAAEDVAGGEQQGADGHLLDGVGVGAGSVEDHDALFGAAVGGNVVEAGTGTGDAEELGVEGHVVKGGGTDEQGFGRLHVGTGRAVVGGEIVKAALGNGVHGLDFIHGAVPRILSLNLPGR